MHDANTTREIELWITNDERYYWEARRRALSGDLAGLAAYCRDTLTAAASLGDEQDQAYYVGRQMSAEDWDAVDWHDIAESLGEE